MVLAFWTVEFLDLIAMGDPATAGDLHGAMDDLAAGVLNPCHSGFDGIDIEIIKPERRRCLRHLGHHAAARRIARRENLIDAHRSHIYGFGFGPAKQAGIEGEGGRPVACMQFMPADMAWRPWRRRRAFLVTCCFKEVEYRPVRVGGDTEAADAGNILGGTVNRATGCLGALCMDIDIIDQDIADPGPPGGLSARVLGDSHTP